MDSSENNFMIKNQKLFSLFCWSGILIEGNVSMKWFSALFISRLCWFLWILLGTGLSIVTSRNIETGITNMSSSLEDMTSSLEDMTSSLEESKEYIFLNERFYIYIPIILILLFFLGPIQGNIIKVNMEKFPNILKSLQQLDEMKIAECIKSDEDEDENTQILNKELDLAEKGKPQRSISVHEKRCTNCYTKNWLPNVSVYIFLILIVVSIMVVSFKLHKWEDLLDEYKLIAIMFYLPLPIITSLFVITLIKEITRLYDIVLNLNDRMFTESKNIEIVSNYLGLLQKTVETMMNDIFEFTLGINFAIFVTSTLMCSYELVEGLKKSKLIDEVDGHKFRKLVNNFGEIDYILPLFVCLFFMFWICKVSDSLMTNVHAKIRLRIRCLLPQLYLQHYEEGAPKGWSDKPFKKLEFLYKSLKDWPPQVYIYGGWKVNYQLLSAIVLFTATYAQFTL